MAIVRNFNLFLSAGHSVPLVINANQYDQGESWVFTLFNSDGTQYIPETGAIVGIKSDGLGIINSGSVVDGKVVITETQQMTAAPGKAVFELMIDNGTHGTANFIVLVEPKPGNNADLSDSDLSLIQEALDAVNPLPTGGSVGQVLTKTANGSAWSNAGTPTQEQVADAVSDWADEHITVTTGVVIDTSLSVAGAAADAKVVGTEISDLKNSSNKIEHAVSFMELSEYLMWNTSTYGRIKTMYFTAEKDAVIFSKNSAYQINVQGYNTEAQALASWNRTNDWSTGTGYSSGWTDSVKIPQNNLYYMVIIRKTNNGTFTDTTALDAVTNIGFVIDNIVNTYAKITYVDELANTKINKNGTEEVIPKNIDSKGYILGEIADDAITLNSYWYATGSGTIASGGAKTGMDKAVLKMSDIGEHLVFGYDSAADYGNGNFVLGLASSEVSPYTRVTYFNKNEIESSNYFELVDQNIVIADITAIKKDYPTAVMFFANIPHSVFALENRINYKKSLEWLAKVMPAIVVAQDGSGDYTTIMEAVNNAVNGDTIYIKDGEYKETVIIDKYLHLEGQSKQGTVLYQNIGDYDNCPLLITQGSVCNMTIKSLAPNDTSGLTDYAYAIHLDKNFASEAKYQKCEIFNCDIYSEVNDAIGAGTNYASEYDIHDCLLHVAHNPVKAGSCGFKCHNGQNQTTGKVTLRNNVIITEDANGTTRYDILFHNGGISNTQPIDILMIGNVLKYYHNGITNIFVPSAYNYGNSVSEMNTL